MKKMTQVERVMRELSRHGFARKARLKHVAGSSEAVVAWLIHKLRKDGMEISYDRLLQVYYLAGHPTGQLLSAVRAFINRENHREAM